MFSHGRFIQSKICENPINQTVTNILKSSVIQSLQSRTPGPKFQFRCLQAVSSESSPSSSRLRFTYFEWEEEIMLYCLPIQSYIPLLIKSQERLSEKTKNIKSPEQNQAHTRCSTNTCTLHPHPLLFEYLI